MGTKLTSAELDVRVRALDRYRRDEWDTPEIAAEAGVSEGQVLQWLEFHGVPLRQTPWTPMSTVCKPRATSSWWSRNTVRVTTP